MENLNKFLGYLMLCLAIVSVVFDVMWVWHKLTDTEQNSNIVIADGIKASEEDKEKTYFIEVNNYDNADKSGMSLFEYKINSFKDTSMQVLKSNGLQQVNNLGLVKNHFAYNGYQGLTWSNEYYAYTYTKGKNDVYEYETSDNVSYTSTHSLIDNEGFIFPIEGEEGIFKFQFKGHVFLKQSLFKKYYNAINSYWLYECLYEQAKSLDYGDYLVNIDLSDYFDIYKETTKNNGKDKIWQKINIADLNKTYITIKIHKENKGVVNSKQSMFGLVKNNVFYNGTEITEKPYWKYDTEIILNNSSFDYRFSELYGGYLASIKLDVLNYIYEHENIVVNLDFDNKIFVNGEEAFCIGFDRYALSGLTLENFVLTANGIDIFYVLNYSFSDTSITDISNLGSAELEISNKAFEHISGGV